jgi:hypothetical protein
MKQFYTIVGLKNITSAEAISSGKVGLFSVDDELYIKDDNQETRKIISTYDIMFQSFALSANGIKTAYVPAGFRITSVIADGRVTDLCIGTTADGVEVVNLFNVDTSSSDCPLGETFFSTTTTTTLYITGTFVGSTTFYFKLDRMI